MARGGGFASIESFANGPMRSSKKERIVYRDYLCCSFLPRSCLMTLCTHCVWSMFRTGFNTSRTNLSRSWKGRLWHQLIASLDETVSHGRRIELKEADAEEQEISFTRRLSHVRNIFKPMCKYIYTWAKNIMNHVRRLSTKIFPSKNLVCKDIENSHTWDRNKDERCSRKIDKHSAHLISENWTSLECIKHFDISKSFRIIHICIFVHNYNT